MNIQINRLANDTIGQVMIVADTVVGVTRAAVEGTAHVLVKAKKPVRGLARTSIQINDITHRSVEKLVKLQAKALERTVDASAARLELAARATSIKALVNEQVSLLPSTRKRISSDLKSTWKVFTDAGTEIGAVFRNGAVPAEAVKRATRKGSAKAKKAAASAKKTTRKTKAKARRATAARKKTTTRGRRKAA